MKGPLALLAIALLSLGAPACGESGSGASSSARTTLAARGSSSGPGSNSSAIPPLRFLSGDYDNDDYYAHSGDTDNDDLRGPRDRDGDADNRSGSYFDGDDRIVRDFGHAASAADRRTIAALLKRYYRVAAAGDGAMGCAMLEAGLAKSVPEVLGSGTGPPYLKGKTCAAVLGKLFAQNRRQMTLFAAALQVSDVRLRGGEGLAILAFKSLPGRALRIVREDGVWKIGALLDNELP